MSEKEPSRPKLIVPETESEVPKTRLMVPGESEAAAAEPEQPEAPATETQEPEAEAEAEAQTEAEAGGFVVINEETGEEAIEPTEPVRIAEMVPPPVEEVEEVVEEFAAAQMAEPAYEEPAYEEPAYEEPAYAEAAEELAPEAQGSEIEQAYDQAAVAYEQPPVQYEEPVPGQYVPPPPPPPAVASPAYPPAAAAYPQHAAQGYPQPGYGAQAPGAAGMYGPAGMPAVGQPSGIPGWALFLLGLLAGFLITLTLFKFTVLAEGLRPDLIERGRDLVKKAQQNVDGEPAPAPTPPAPAPQPDPADPVDEPDPVEETESP